MTENLETFLFTLNYFLDNLQAAFTLRQKYLFQKTLKALELHLVSTSAFIEASGCQLAGKEDGDSSSTKKIRISKKLSYGNKLFKAPP